MDVSTRLLIPHPPTARPASGSAASAGAIKSEEATAQRSEYAPMIPLHYEQKMTHGSSSSIPWPQKERRQEQGEEDGSGSGGGGRVGAADGGAKHHASTY